MISGKKPLIVDLHIHSKYAQATSPYLSIDELYVWAKCKGIHILGTGDFTHPMWLNELQEKLEPAEPGLFKLKDTYAQELDTRIPETCRNEIFRFVLSVEISNVYTRAGRGRRVHNVIIMPSFQSVEKLNKHLSTIGNLSADGRPILGMDSEDLLMRTLDTDSDALFVPAHIWTPWYGLLGSQSGFDSVDEAFGENSKHIYAIESGLDSDPEMNRHISSLDRYTILSNSDAHSVQKLAREANLIACNLDYFDMIDAIKTHDERFVGTIEFFPEEGKYHLDGHRACGICFTPDETRVHKGICPVCGRKLTVGVLHQIHDHFDRPSEYKHPHLKETIYIFPLVELVADVHDIKNTQSKKVMDIYWDLIQKLGPEFDILREISTTSIEQAGYPNIAHAMSLLRSKDVKITPGYDGVFGKVHVTIPDATTEVQDSLF